MQVWLRRFPTTEVTSSSGSNQRLLNELRIANSRLLNGTELNLVRILIQQYIQAVEKGEFVDNRPKKQ